MAKFYTELSDELRQFIAEQHIFFTATAPIQGRINLSPKGIDTFRCLDAHTVAYLDLTGSGNETAAHLHENGRMTIMFCSFGDCPLILRLYGQGRILHQHDPDWQPIYARFPTTPGERQLVVLAIESVQTSCGFGVPQYAFQGHRDTLIAWAEKKGEAGLEDYRRRKNQTSIDGLPTQLPAR